MPNERETREVRRHELSSLLGALPPRDRPISCAVVAEESRDEA